MRDTNSLELAKKAIQNNDPKTALEHLMAAQEKYGESARLLSQSGICLMMLGEAEKAIATFERALKLEPGKPAIANNLMRAYLRTDQTGLAADLADRDHGTPDLIMEIARALWRDGETIRAVAMLRRGEDRFPDSDDLRHLRGAFATSLAPAWHIPMTAHQSRNSAYRTAIERTVKPGDIALDIGTGSGLLAMMAVRAGCAHVYACEVNPMLAQIARETLARNGMSDRVTLIEKHSTALEIGTDLPQKVDLLVTEIFDNALVGEGALPSIQDARDRLLHPDARLVPQSASLKGALVASPGFASYHAIEDVEGFDLTPLNTVSHPLAYKDANTAFDNAPGNTRLSAPFEIFGWDFRRDIPQSFAQTCTLVATASGTADALLMWFELELCDGVTFTSANPEPFDHWREVLQPLNTPVSVNTDDSVDVTVAYDRYFRIHASAP